MVSNDARQIALERIEQAAREKIEKLDLSFLQLTELPPEIGKLSHLKYLDLRSNRLTTLPPEIANLTQLTSFYVVKNQLETLPLEIGELCHLERLHLSYNHLETLPPTFGQLVALNELYLSHNYLTSLPEEIQFLTHLKQLALSFNQLQTLPSTFGHLHHLTWLDLNSNKLTAIFQGIEHLSSLSELNLSYNQIKRLSPEMGQLSSLVELNLSYNQIEILPPEIGQLQTLDFLYLSHNLLTILPPEIGQLKSLIILDLIYNHLNFLPSEIGHLKKLTELRLNRNNLRNLPAEIAYLTRLSKLSLKGNKLTYLPTEIIQLAQFSKLNYLDLSENLLPIPPEVIWKKNEPRIIIDFYKQNLTGITKPLNEAKVLLVGQGSVGKTSLIRRLLYDSFDLQQDKTDGLEIRPWQVEINNERIKLNLWDFGGQEIYHATHQFFLTQRSIYLVVLDSRLDEKDNQLEYWLQIIKSYGNNSPIIVVNNKTDQHTLDLDYRGLKKRHKNIKAFLETSCKKGKGIQKLKETILQEVSNLEHIYTPLRTTWIAIKEQLEKMKNNNWDYILYDKYQNMCEQQGITTSEEKHHLIRFLHDLGVVLNFQDDLRLKDTNILNPQWVTKGVYRILNDEALQRKPYYGILSLSMLERILDDPKYPKNKHMFIIDMMRKFELCFELEYDDYERNFLIPDLLPKEEIETGEWQDSLTFQYHYNVLPSSIISRFIVRMNHLVHKGNYWRNGVILIYQENTALVKSERDYNKILISVKGLKETRRDFLKVIRFELNQIHQTIPGLQVKEKVVIFDEPEICVDYQHLLTLEQMGIEMFVPEGLKEKMNVRELLEGFIPEGERERSSPLSSSYVSEVIPNNSLEETEQNSVATVPKNQFFTSPIIIFIGLSMVAFILILLSQVVDWYILLTISLIGSLVIVLLRKTQKKQRISQPSSSQTEDQISPFK